MTHFVRPNGYLLVRRHRTPYRGPDRQPWDGLDEMYWGGLLRADVHAQYDQMRSERGFWWPTVRSLSQAEALASYSEEAWGGPSEIIAVFSPYLASLGRATCSDAGAFVQCGLDVISVGEWSLVRALTEAYPGSDEIQRLINELGLVSDSDSIQSIVRKYHSAVEEGRVEELGEPTPDRGIETVVVFNRE